MELWVSDSGVFNDSEYNLMDLPLEKTRYVSGMTDLAKRIEACLSSVSKSVKILKEAGLVEWEVSERSGEKSFLCLTIEGKKEAEKLLLDIFDLIPSESAYSFLVKVKYGSEAK